MAQKFENMVVRFARTRLAWAWGARACARARIVAILLCSLVVVVGVAPCVCVCVCVRFDHCASACVRVCASQSSRRWTCALSRRVRASPPIGRQQTLRRRQHCSSRGRRCRRRRRFIAAPSDAQVGAHFSPKPNQTRRQTSKAASWAQEAEWS